MDAIRKLILDTATEKGVELKEISLKLGKNHAYMHQYIHKNTPKRLHADDRAIVSRLLKLPETALGAPVSISDSSGAELQSHEPNATISDKRVEMGPTVPQYGTAVGGVDGQFELNGNLLDHIRSPMSLIGVKNAYAVQIAGDSMSPRYEDGETVFVNPDRRVIRNDYVVAQVRVQEDGPPLAYVKRFVRWNSEKLVLSQWNPEKELVFDSANVESVHYILKNGE